MIEDAEAQRRAAQFRPYAGCGRTRRGRVRPQRVACVLAAIARGALGGPASAGHALERALDLAEPSGTVMAFLLHPAPGLLERHARQRTAHA